MERTRELRQKRRLSSIFISGREDLLAKHLMEKQEALKGAGIQVQAFEQPPIQALTQSRADLHVKVVGHHNQALWKNYSATQKRVSEISWKCRFRER